MSPIATQPRQTYNPPVKNGGNKTASTCGINQLVRPRNDAMGSSARCIPLLWTLVLQVLHVSIRWWIMILRQCPQTNPSRHRSLYKMLCMWETTYELTVRFVYCGTFPSFLGGCLCAPSQKTTPTRNASANKAKRPHTSSGTTIRNTSRYGNAVVCTSFCQDFGMLLLLLLLRAVIFFKQRVCVGLPH